MSGNIFLLIISSFSFFMVQAQNIPVGDWRVHLPYQNTSVVTESRDAIYGVAEKGLFRIGKGDGALDRLAKTRGFSDVEVSSVKYYPEKDLVFVAYENTNIDIIKGNRIINIADILRKTILGQKRINHIYFHGDAAFLSTSFGVVVVDLDKFEIKESYLNIGPGGTNLAVNATSIYQDTIYIATNSGIRRAPFSQTVNLGDFNRWSLFRPSSYSNLLADYNGKLYAVVDSVLEVFDGSGWSFFDGNIKQATMSIVVNHGKLVVTQQKVGFIIEDKSGQRKRISENIINYGILDELGRIWFAANNSGIVRVDEDGKYNFFIPNGPSGSTSHQMVGFNNQVWVSGGGIAGNYGPTFNNNGLYRFKDGLWSKTNSDSDPALAGFRDFTSIAVNKSRTRAFVGTHFSGLAELDLNGNLVKVYDQTNSTLGTFATTTWVFASGLAFDNQNNLWVTNYQSFNDSALSVLTANGTWKAFKFPTSSLGNIIVDDFSRKWMLAPRSNDKGILVFDDNKTPLVNSDDRFRILDQTNGLPSNNVISIAKDRDGEIWIGTDKGPAVFFNPSNVFSTTTAFEARQIVIGSGDNVGILLGNEVINCIVIDGANRKWMGTGNGAWLISPDGNEVLLNFNTGNSPLLSNNVLTIGIHEQTGEVFFGTDKGIVSYRGTATEGKETHSDVTVFPNPVRENFDGIIAVNGLPTNAIVKITDITGRVVYETIATGGQATWNGRRFDGSKPKTGVYLIFTTNDDGTDSMVSKLLFIN